MSILNYDEVNKKIVLMEKFSDKFPGVDIYSSNFKDCFQSYINGIIDETSVIMSGIKNDFLVNPDIVVSEGKTITISDIMTISKSSGENIINFISDIFFDSVSVNTVNSKNVTSDTMKVANSCDIGKIISIKENSLSVGLENIVSNNVDGGAEIKNLNIENNLIVKGDIRNFLPEGDGDFVFDFGFFKISRTSGETIIEFKENISFITNKGVYIGNVKTDPNLAITRSYMDFVNEKIDSVVSDVSEKISEFWSSFSIPDFVIKVTSNSKIYYNTFSSSNLKLEYNISDAFISDCIINFSNVSSNCSTEVKKILTYDESGAITINSTFGVIDELTKNFTVPQSLLSEGIIKLKIYVTVTDNNSNKSTSMTLLINGV